MEDLTVSRLHVSLHSIQAIHSSKHQMTTGTSAMERRENEQRKLQYSSVLVTLFSSKTMRSSWRSQKALRKSKTDLYDRITFDARKSLWTKSSRYGCSMLTDQTKDDGE